MKAPLPSSSTGPGHRAPVIKVGRKWGAEQSFRVTVPLWKTDDSHEFLLKKKNKNAHPLKHIQLCSNFRGSNRLPEVTDPRSSTAYPVHPFHSQMRTQKVGRHGGAADQGREASLLSQPDLYYKGTGRKINSSEGILCGLYKWSIQKGCSPGAFYLKICKRIIWIAKPATPFSISIPSSQVISLPERRGRILTVLLWETSPTTCTSPSSPLVLQSHQPFPPSRGCPFPIEARTGLLGCLKPLNTVCHSLRVSAVWKLSFLFAGLQSQSQGSADVGLFCALYQGDLKLG